MVAETAKSRKPTSRRAPGKSSVPASDNQSAGQLDQSTIRIRMYRVGFGDCFLLSLPTANGKSNTTGLVHILVDCGVHPQGDVGTLEKAVEDIASLTNGKLAIIIATHAHRDHLAGFDKFGDKFGTFEIGEVWLPWTWDPKNSQAVELQKKQAALTAQLALHFALDSSNANAVSAINNLTGNEHAIELLKSGFGVGAKVRYLTAGDSLSSPDIPVPGLSVRILGPPQSTDFLSQMNPPSGEEYLRMSSEEGKSADVLEPFSHKWKLGRNAPELAYIQLPPLDEKQLQDTLSSPLSDLAFSIDQARNNESVVSLFVFRGKNLLFPGDAQYGNWKWWLDNLKPETILPQIDFYKVAHHGSINATPKDALEGMTDGRPAAMVSTQSKPWPSIPRVQLMTRLSEKTGEKIVRSDWLTIAGASGPSPDATPPLPPTPPQGFVEGQFWFDYLINLS